MRTPAKNAKLLRILADKAEGEGCTHAAEQIRDCAFQLDVFELVGLKLELRGDKMVHEAIELVEQGVVSDCVHTPEDLEPKRGHMPSDFNISRN